MNYWDKYYKTFKESQPSKFAKSCLKYLNPHSTIIDLGCGNGRDSSFFKSKGFSVLPVDKAKHINIPYIQEDFTKLNNIPIDNIYMRFSLHSITKVEENRVLRWAYRNLLDGVLCIEVRSIKDRLYGKGVKVGVDEYIYTHYRRFIRKEELEQSLKKIGFKILYSKERRNFAPYKRANPKILRIIAKK